jgi:hypothetical protein
MKMYYKGFDSKLKCRGYQFEIGATYKHNGAVSACSSGFHSCSNPWDVLSYYDITSRFAYVEIGGETSTHQDYSKIASAEITIKAELELPEFITDCINYMKAACKSDIEPSGDSSQLAASGESSQLAASGDSSQLAASGESSQLVASGNYSKLVASGNYSQLAASGFYSQLAASGDYSKLVASGNYSKLAASGNYSQLAASGDSSKLAASGYYSKLVASGNYSKLAASGDSSKLAASGDYSIAISVGVDSRVKGGTNCALALTRWVESEKRYRIIVAYVGENGINPDTWYELNKDGKFIECKE